MKNLVILGAGTAGTIMANRLARELKSEQWQIHIVDQYAAHYYQPGFLFIPFGVYGEKDVVKPQRKFLPKGVRYIQEEIDLIEPDHNRVRLKNGDLLNYDALIVATGAKIAPQETEGLAGSGWQRNIFDFYTIEGALALGEMLKNWNGGRLLLNVAQMPIKCPVAPLEFLLLADAYFAARGMRDKVELVYATPLDSAFTKPNCSRVLGYMLEQKDIQMHTQFDIERVDPEANRIVSYDNREVGYDILVSIPVNMGDEAIERSGMGDDLNFIPTHKHTLQSKKHENIFVLGDATDLPSSKAGSVAHFQSEVLTENILRFAAGQPPLEGFDGHANCFIESGHGKAFLIDFNYDIEPLTGTFPLPVLGPFSLLKETHINHWGKMAFRWVYWNLLLKGRPMPGIGTRMQLAGKHHSALIEQKE